MAASRELLTFVETATFSKRLVVLELEDALLGLQLELLANPEAGDLEPGTGGLRKVRLPDPKRSKGKRGGARAHYLWLPNRGRIYLVFVYAKNEVITLTPEQRRQLRNVVTEIRRIG